MKIIEADRISYKYPAIEDDFEEEKKEKKISQKGEYAVKETSLSIEEGQFICILGRNGSGKSTFAKHLNALLTPSEGTLWVDGMNTSEEDVLWDVRKTVGMVFQNPDNQIIGSVVDEEVAFGLENLGIDPPEIRKRVADALNEVGLKNFDKVSPNKLSGGQKQRLAIAGIVAMAPKCIVLDEATAMLDPRGRKEVMDTVRKLNRDKGITIICITHYMDEVLDADYVFVMNRGELKMQGSPRDIFSRAEEIEALGLVLPQICQLAEELRKGGMDIPKGILTADELRQAIKSVKSEY